MGKSMLKASQANKGTKIHLRREKQESFRNREAFLMYVRHFAYYTSESIKLFCYLGIKMAATHTLCPVVSLIITKPAITSNNKSHADLFV